MEMIPRADGSMSESDSWDHKCCSDVQGNDQEFNEDWSYKIPEEHKQTVESDGGAQGKNSTDIVVQSPTLSPTSLINEIGQIAGLYGSLSRGMDKGGKGGGGEVTMKVCYS